ncbi:MAG: alpha/beta hydrolase [Asgard group archaeon]|nr:alpha/beta hydrolase [Asgard group archaeon]
MDKIKIKKISFLVICSISFFLMILSTSLHHLKFNRIESKGQKIVFTDDFGNQIFNQYYEGTNGKGVMIFHGYGEDQNSMRGYTIEFNRRGYHVFTTDFFGHGRSSGAFISNESTDDILANQVLLAKNEFKKNTGFNDSEIYMVGHSYGARAILRASLIDTNTVGGLFLIGPAIHLLSKDFFENNWTQSLSSLNPNTNITIISGKLDDICPPEETRALFQKLSNETVFGDRYVFELPNGNQRGILIIDGLSHTYEVNAPYAIKDCVTQIMYLQGGFYPLELPQEILYMQRLRHITWICLPFFMLLTCVFGFLFLENMKTQNQQDNNNKEIITLEIESSLKITNLKRFFVFKTLFAFLSLIVGFLPILLMLIIPINVPLFSLIYPIAIGGYGIIMMILLRYNKMPGIKGNLQFDAINIKKFAVKDIAIVAIVSIIFTTIATYFFNSEWYHIFPGNIRLLWLFALTIFSSVGFYINRTESEIIRQTYPGKLGMQIANYCLFLVPLIIGTISIAASGILFIFFEILHGFLLLLLVQIVGAIINKICKNKTITALLLAFILMFLIIPKGPLVTIF